MKRIAVSGSLLALCAVSFLSAQQAPVMPAPQKEHEWLKQFVGEWEVESETVASPGQPAMKCKGTLSSRAVGGFWVVTELNTEMMGTPVVAFQTIGYDPQSKKYVGTWVDSMLSHLWKYEGTVDEMGKILTLEAEGPNFMAGGKIAKFRDIYEFKSKDHMVTSSTMQGEDGKWVAFMTGNARCKK